MRIDRRVGAMVLYGGWLLLFNPEHNRPAAPLSTWKKIDDFDTAYECEQKRQEEALDATKEDDPKKRLSATDAELRYRCERQEHVPAGR
jgi:hypothetical protein